MRIRSMRLACCGLLLLVLNGCASGPPLYDWPSATTSEPVPIEIEEVPFFAQEAYQCGPASLAGVLNWSGLSTTPDELSPYLYIPEKQGTLQPELLAQSRRLGRIPYVIPPHPEALQAELSVRHPVLVLQNNGLSWYPVWHYAVVVGADTDDDGDARVVLRSGDMQRYPLDADTFMHTWQRSGYWGVVILPPGELPASVEPDDVLRAIDDFSSVAEFEDVMHALDAAAKRWPDDLGILFAIGNHRYAGGDIEGAEAAYRRAILHHADAVAVRNNLAWLLAEQGRIDEARREIAAARKAAQLRSRTQHDFAEEISDTGKFIECRATGSSIDECQRSLGEEEKESPDSAGEKLGNSGPH